MSTNSIVMMPGRAFVDERLSRADLRLLAVFGSHNADNGFLRERTLMPDEATREQIHRLVDLGYLAEGKRDGAPAWRLVLDFAKESDE